MSETVGEKLAGVATEVRNLKEDLKGEDLPARVRALESWRSLLLGIGTAITLMGGIVGFVWGDAIRKALGGP